MASITHNQKGRNAETSPELRGARKIIDRIKNAPTADVVKVVRCKDCKHVDKYGDCDIFDEWSTRTANDFCSYGERKTDETD